MSVGICIIDDTLHFSTSANIALHVLHCDELLPSTECRPCHQAINLASGVALSPTYMASGAMNKMCCKHL